MATGWLWDERYAWFDAGTWNDFSTTPAKSYAQPQEAFENPETKRRFRNLLDITGVLDQLVQLRARPATDEEILRVHTPEHLAGVRALAATGGDAGNGTAMGKFGDEIAILAAGGSIVAADAVLDGTVDNAYALVRPPGHHAEPGLAMGFCVFSNIGIAIRHAQQVRGVTRVAVVDWDVHHGNGTETIFLADPGVLAISLHQDEHYPPGRGRVDVVGEGAARGTNLNIPLPPGSGRSAYGYAFERVVVPALRAFRPELIIVASGFDASAYDPLGRMDLSADDFRALTASLMEVAADVSDGRLLMSHEGGYSSFYVPYCGLAVLEQMSGHRSDTDFSGVAPDSHRSGPRPLEAHERAAVERAAANVELVPQPG
ncbi:MAG TPA: class II histone deacetylase [Gaiellales bacterium]|jgi:acetoin utilization deacetylase AcuC-like enzyme|nr:class II histone deacetylase [Gaiellales bacterium]